MTHCDALACHGKCDECDEPLSKRMAEHLPSIGSFA